MKIKPDPITMLAEPCHLGPCSLFHLPGLPPAPGDGQVPRPWDLCLCRPLHLPSSGMAVSQPGAGTPSPLLQEALPHPQASSAPYLRPRVLEDRSSVTAAWGSMGVAPEDRKAWPLGSASAQWFCPCMRGTVATLILFTDP